MVRSSPLAVRVDALLRAVAAFDVDGFYAALPAIAQSAEEAAPEEIQAALVRLEPALRPATFALGGGLAGLLGQMAWNGTDPAAVMPLLADRAADVLEQAVRFRALYRDAFGEPPAPREQEAAGAVLERFAGSARRRGLDPDAAEMLVQAWFCAEEWVQPVLYLCQRAEVRATLPQRERLTAAVAAARELYGTASWLWGLLRVVDHEQLIVVDRDFARTGRGFRVTVGGIGDNFQLHILLAATLIGDPGRGLLPGRRPTAAEFAAATDGNPQPPGGIRGCWNLVDARGEWIWNEGTPADIPRLDGVRLIALDREPYARTWNAGRSYPRMAPRLLIDGALAPGEAAHWLARIGAPRA
ncbi:hypothetical protein ACQP00_17070 [Dactylosporangium sp. CS-047395]|uniref:hypothetical protein n=1 Tax=Dactylosporangium sp. CS-047395 TaxID=3239936 RepID=UPI003D8AEC8B